MPCGTWITTDVPEADLPRVIFNYNLDDPISVTQEQQADGNWTVTAKFEDCPEGQPNTTERSHSDEG
jgi:hypothetical protein